MPELTARTNVCDFEDAMSALILARFQSGEQPHGCTFDVQGVADAADLVPLDAVERSARTNSVQRLLAQVDGCSVTLDRYANGHTSVVIAGPTQEAVLKVEALIRANAPVVEEAATDVEVEFWCNTPQGVRRLPRRIDAPTWGEVAGNYPAPVAGELARLISLSRPRGDGRLLLWHGPPGTGKTTAARALAREWAEWCRTLFVVDADELFGKGSYLTSLLLASEQFDDGAAGDDDDDEVRKWRLLVIEDADELLRADAKHVSGQAMARLLNLADGFLGQGLDLLILLSTNEPIGRLHPAVVRPGRCLAEIGFRPFTRAEASAWLGADAGGESATLAELFHRRGDVARIGAVDDRPVPGQYL